MLLVFSLFFILALASCDDYPVPRGAQIRLTKNGLNYGASIGIRKLQQELTNKAIPSQSGRKGDASFNAQNIIIHYLQVGGYTVQPLANVGLRLSVSGISVSAQGRVSVNYRKGWIKIGDTTNVNIRGNGVAFTLDVKIGAHSGKPTLNAISCGAHISNLNLNFSGGLSWLYNIFSSLLEGKLKDILKKVICAEGSKLANVEANKFLNNFPVTQNIVNWAKIDYSFEQPVMMSNYIDLLLRGEFLDYKNPVHSTVAPPSFATNTGSSKMVSVWISDFTLNSAGKVFHNAGLLKNLISPAISADLIPANLKMFLNTKSFEYIIPELYKRFPNQPIQFDLATYQAPSFDIQTGKIDVKLYVKAIVGVLHSNGTTTTVFYMKINVNAVGSVFIKSINKQLIVGGNIVSFSPALSVGGSVIGEINLPIDNKGINTMIRGLVIDQANPILNKGFPIPKIPDLDFKNSAVGIVQDAIRVETDVSYIG